MIQKIRKALKRLAEQPRTGQDKELEIFEGLSPDRFDEAIAVHTMQTEMRTIDKVFDTIARSKIPESNPCYFSDSQAQHLSDMWFRQQKTATVEQKHRVGMAYIADFLGLGEEIAEAFRRGSRRNYFVIGHNRVVIHNSSPYLFRNNVFAFWRKIKEIFPDDYSREDVEFLSKLSFRAVEHFMMQVEPILAEDAQINRSLRSNEVFFFPKGERV
jgi:hypothetical protein